MGQAGAGFVAAGGRHFRARLAAGPPEWAATSDRPQRCSAFCHRVEARCVRGHAPSRRRTVPSSPRAGGLSRRQRRIEIDKPHVSRYVTRSRACSSAGRAPDWQSGGQGFDPPQVHRRRFAVRRQLGPARPHREVEAGKARRAQVRERASGGRGVGVAQALNPRTSPWGRVKLRGPFARLGSCPA